VILTNRAPTSVDGWSATITLPQLGLTVGAVRGAEARQSGRIVTFTPNGDTASVPANGAVLFDFTVDGGGAPTGCTVDAQPCAGLPG
jgi:endoglucanase